MKSKRLIIAAFVVLFLGGFTGNLRAEGYFEKNNQVFFRGAFSLLSHSRSGEVFTDTAGAGGFNNGKAGFSVATGLDLGLMKPESLFGVASLAGEMFMEFSRFSKHNVVQATSALLAKPQLSNVPLTELNVSVNPKLKFDTLGRFRPWVIPIGVAFLVNSPPSNDTTYLDLGLNFGAGLDVYLLKWLNVGVDARYTLGLEMSHTKTSYFSTGLHAGINF